MSPPVWRGIAILLLLASFPSCRKPAAENDALVVLSPGGAMRKPVEAAVAEFSRENPGVAVKIVSTPGQDYYVKSLTMLAGRADVDVLWLGQGFGMFATRGALLDLAPFLKEDPAFPIREYNPTAVDWYRHRGGLYGLPYGIDVQAIAYNKDLFDAARVPYPRTDWTLEEMLETARKLTRRQNGSGLTQVAGLGFLDLDYRYYGLSLLDKSQSRFALNTELGRQWLHRNVTLIHRDHLLQQGSDIASIDRLTGFLNQQVAMAEFSTWDLAGTRSRAPFRWDIVAIPTGFGGKRTGWASSSGFSIARHSRHPALAWKLLKKLTGPEFQRAMLAATIPAWNSLHAEYLAGNPAPPQHLSELLKMLDSMQPNPRIGAFNEVNAEWTYWKEKALLRKIPVEEALEQAESNVNRILKLHHGEEPQ